MTAAISTTTINVGDWVELKKSVKGSGILVKGSRWFVQEVNVAKEAIKVSNGKSGEDERTECFYFQDVILTSQFQKGDIVQHTEDNRYIGRVTQSGQRVKVKWADGKEDYVESHLINLFTRTVSGNQEVIGEYAFKAGDRVETSAENYKGVIFTVRECYPSGMVGLVDDEDEFKSIPGNWLSVVSHQLSVISEHPDSEHCESSSDHCEDSEESEPVKSICENFTDDKTLAWIDPRTVDTEAGTQTRYREDVQQISLYAEKMLAGEWEWEREPLPELVQDGANYYVVSGHHRIKAALEASTRLSSEANNIADDSKVLGAIQIYCRITPGTLEDAKLLAIRSDANDYHGVPESRADFRNRVEKFFNILDSWDTTTQIRELEQLKFHPHASEAVGAIDRLLNRLRREEEGEGWTSRIVAAYLRSPRSYATISKMMTARQSEAVFRSVVSSLSDGDWVQYQQGEEVRIGRIIYLSKTTITVLSIDKTYVTFNSSSPVELLRSIEVTELVESEQPTTEPEEDEEEDTPPPVKPVQSVAQELNGKAKELGLPTSENQVLPDTSESDRLRNASPYDVDDRPFATPEPMPQRISNEYLIGFVSNTKDMTQPQIRCALEAIFEWMEANGKTQNLGYLKTVINDL